MKKPGYKKSAGMRNRIIIISFTLLILLIILIMITTFIILHNKKKTIQPLTPNRIQKLKLDKETIKKFKKDYEDKCSSINANKSYFKLSTSREAALVRYLNLHYKNLKYFNLKFPKISHIQFYITENVEMIPILVEIAEAIKSIIETQTKIKRVEIKELKFPLSKSKEASDLQLSDESVTILKNNYIWVLNIRKINQILIYFSQSILTQVKLTKITNLIYKFAEINFINNKNDSITVHKWENDEENKIGLLFIANYPNITEGLSWSLLYLILTDYFTKSKTLKEYGKTDKFFMKFEQEKKEYVNFEYIIGLIYKLFDIAVLEKDELSPEVYKKYIEDNRNIVDAIFDVLETEMEMFVKYIKSLF